MLQPASLAGLATWYARMNVGALSTLTEFHGSFAVAVGRLESLESRQGEGQNAKTSVRTCRWYCPSMSVPKVLQWRELRDWMSRNGDAVLQECRAKWTGCRCKSSPIVGLCRR